MTAPKKHLFTNIAFCADCGTGMWYRQNRKGYICGGYGRHGSKKCSHHAIKESGLKSIILSDLKKYAREISKEGLIKKLEQQTVRAEKTTNKKLASIEREMKRLVERKSKFLNLLANEIITKADYQRAIEEINRELKRLSAQKTELQHSLESKNIHEEIAKLKAELDKYLLFNDLTEEMLHRFVRRIEIKADGTPKIFYTRVRQSLGKQNASRPLIQKGSEAFGHTSGVYLGARVDA
ncbi:recombinase zinc beta ribbon domain-containing protein [Aeribacillus sp. FSL K6-2848]|uniref:recombinase zinc beta ribbon domain-containing protein n=1 Tax=Aeribacillus sp. FSL K6-2848 TaxID=2954612 RepID=UPI0030F753C3